MFAVPEADRLTQQAELLRANGDRDGAERLLQTALEADPGHLLAMTRLAEIAVDRKDAAREDIRSYGGVHSFDLARLRAKCKVPLNAKERARGGTTASSGVWRLAASFCGARPVPDDVVVAA
ncbi:MAG: tetratricopeptide repeat protein, partial [Rhodospirillales bacterium]|nr:tetratricopeptide repeat protein [Rhodospirillales bacterium]